MTEKHANWWRAQIRRFRKESTRWCSAKSFDGTKSTYCGNTEIAEFCEQQAKHAEHVLRREGIVL